MTSTDAVAVRPAALQPRRSVFGVPPERLAMLLVPLGAGLGPSGLALLNEGLLSILQPGISAALAAIGVFVGLDLDFGIPRARTATAAFLEVVASLLPVAAAVWVLRPFIPDLATSFPLEVAIGACAIASTMAGASNASRAGSVRAIAAFDQVLAIAATGLLLAWMREGSLVRAAWLIVQVGLLGVVLAAAGWLLVSQTGAHGEQRVFTIGTLLLLGGAALQLSLSPLVAGLTAGVCWRFVDADARDRIRRDLSYLRHLLIVLLLVTAGAQLQATRAVLAIAVVYAVCRLGGKVAGGRLASLADRSLTSDAALQLLPPGLVGVAAAMAIRQSSDAFDTTTLFAIVVIGSVAAEAASWMASPGERRT